MVRDAIIEETRATQQNLTAATLRVEQLTAELSKRQQSSSELSLSLGRAVNELEAEHQKVDSLAAQVANLQSAISENRETRTRTTFSAIWSALLLAALILANLAVALIAPSLTSISPAKLHVLVSSIATAMWLLAASAAAKRTPAIRVSRWYSRLTAARNWLFGTLLVAILANAIWAFFAS
jgi:hypothetical protein